MECDEFKQTYGFQHIQCCTSCHEDADTGYGDDLWFEVDNRDWNICCALANRHQQIHTEIK